MKIDAVFWPGQRLVLANPGRYLSIFLQVDWWNWIKSWTFIATQEFHASCEAIIRQCFARGTMYETLSSNKCSRFNPVPSIYLYSALVQLLSTLIVDEDITLVLRYIYLFRYIFIYLIGIFVLHFSSEFQTQVEPVSYCDFHSRL